MPGPERDRHEAVRADDASGASRPQAARLPSTCGAAGADGLSEVNFGSIETPTGILFVEVLASAAREVGLDRDGFLEVRAVRATISGPSPYGNPSYPTYRVDEIEVLDL